MWPKFTYWVYFLQVLNNFYTDFYKFSFIIWTHEKNSKIHRKNTPIKCTLAKKYSTSCCLQKIFIINKARKSWCPNEHSRWLFPRHEVFPPFESFKASLKTDFHSHPLGRRRKSLQHPVHRRWKWLPTSRWLPSDPAASAHRDRPRRRISEVAAVDRAIGVKSSFCYCRLTRTVNVNKFLRWKEKFSSLLLAVPIKAQQQQRRAFDSGIDIENRLQIVIVQMALNGKQKFIRRSGLVML